MGLDEAIESQRGAARSAAGAGAEHMAEADSFTTEARRLYEEFLTRMQAAGNPGRASYPVADGKGLRALVRPRVSGWRIPGDRVMTGDGRIFSGRRVGPSRGKLDQVSLGTDLLAEWRRHHGSRMEGGGSAFTVQSVEALLAQVLLDYGAG
jgi:hypothetical protein